MAKRTTASLIKYIDKIREVNSVAGVNKSRLLLLTILRRCLHKAFSPPPAQTRDTTHTHRHHHQPTKPQRLPASHFKREARNPHKELHNEILFTEGKNNQFSHDRWDSPKNRCTAWTSCCKKHLSTFNKLDCCKLSFYFNTLRCIVSPCTCREQYFIFQFYYLIECSLKYVRQRKMLTVKLAALIFFMSIRCGENGFILTWVL